MIKYYDDLLQGSQEWKDTRCGLLTASEVHLIMTPSTLKIANNEKKRDHVYEIAAQRVNKYVEPRYISDDMMRGKGDEILARDKYSEVYGEVREVGFITNDKWGFTIGYSPDGLCGDDGLIECKSRIQKLQLKTIANGEIPEEHVLQLQTALLVSERSWIDFISYCGGMRMFVKRVYPNNTIQGNIIQAAAAFEADVSNAISCYNENSVGLVETERSTVLEEEMII